MQPDETAEPTVSESKAPEGGPFSWRQKAAFVVIGCVVLLFCGEGYYRIEYGNTSPWSVPARFTSRDLSTARIWSRRIRPSFPP